MDASFATLRKRELSRDQFHTLAQLVYRACGIHLEITKKTMVESRLNKRLRALAIDSFEQYIAIVQEPGNQDAEFIEMLDAITTNKTDFFREPHHFDFLQTTIVPEMAMANEEKTVRIWSAACSTGEEPYTLAMVLKEAQKNYPELSFNIAASDISTAALRKAVDAIYPAERSEDIPVEYRKKYVLKSKDTSNQRIRMSPSLRTAVTFSRINLIDSEFRMERLQDIIFCRNVLIYFDAEVKNQVLHNLYAQMNPDAWLVTSHSESLIGLNTPLKSLRPSIYRRTRS